LLFNRIYHEVDLKDNPRILAELKKHIQAVEKDLGDAVSWDIPAALKENIPVNSPSVP
jgi:hypothetical protein